MPAGGPATSVLALLDGPSIEGLVSADDVRPDLFGDVLAAVTGPAADVRQAPLPAAP